MELQTRPLRLRVMAAARLRLLRVAVRLVGAGVADYLHGMIEELETTRLIFGPDASAPFV